MRTKLGTTCGLAALGLSSLAMAGEEPAAKGVLPAVPPSCPWTLEAALLYLEADASDYGSQDYEFGYRLGLSYQADPSGWGYRLRYFNFEGTGNRSDKSDSWPEIEVIDLEAFRPVSLGGWDGEWSIGIRSLDLEQPHNNHEDVDYSGIGPVVGIDLTKDINGTYAFYVNGRASYLFGDDDEDSAADDAPVLEAGVGIQRTLNIGNCGGHVRLGLEAHRYFELGYDEEDADLFGGVLGFSFGF